MVETSYICQQLSCYVFARESIATLISYILSSVQRTIVTTPYMHMFYESTYRRRSTCAASGRASSPISSSPTSQESHLQEETHRVLWCRGLSDTAVVWGWQWQETGKNTGHTELSVMWRNWCIVSDVANVRTMKLLNGECHNLDFWPEDDMNWSLWLDPLIGRSHRPPACLTLFTVKQAGSG